MRTLLSHLRLGYAVALVVVSVGVPVAVIADMYRYAASERDLTLASRLAYRQLDWPVISDVLATAVVLLFLLPLALGVARTLTGGLRHGPPWFQAALSHRGRAVFLAQLALTLIVCAGIVVVSALPETAGVLKKPGEAPEYAFGLAWTPLVTPFGLSALVSFGLAVVSFVAGPLFEWTVHHSPRFSGLGRYIARAKLADLQSDYYPLHGRRAGNFNAAAVAPAIRAIHRATRGYIREYQRSIPGSLAAKRHLEDHWEAVRELIRSTIGAAPSTRIVLFESTSRAFDACIAPLGQVHLILSPYEHESELKVAELRKKASKATVQELPRHTQWLAAPSRAGTISEVAGEIARSLVSDYPNVVVLSEVCCVTGLPTEAPTIQAAVRQHEAAAGKSIYFVLDGAHSVGHRYLDGSWRAFDLYVFSGHKWLLAEHPSGVAVLLNPDMGEPLPYDAWDIELPSTIADVGTVVALRASLTWLITSGGANDLAIQNRSAEVRDELCRRLPNTVEAVRDGDVPPGRVLAVRPGLHYRWRDAGGLKRAMAKLDLNCEVFEVADGSHNAWLRVTLSHFHDVNEIERLCKAIEEQVTPQ